MGLSIPYSTNHVIHFFARVGPYPAPTKRAISCSTVAVLSVPGWYLRNTTSAFAAILSLFKRFGFASMKCQDANKSLSVCLCVYVLCVIVQSVPPKPPLSFPHQDGRSPKTAQNLRQNPRNAADFPFTVVLYGENPRKNDRISCIKNEKF